MMKQFLLSICLLCACTTLQAQGRKHTTFYDQRATLFEVLSTSKKDIIFLGNSITNGCEWAELLGNAHAKNRGISGDTTNGVLDRLHVITAGKPSKVFLLIGINDLSGGLTVDSIAKNIETIVKRIKKESPATRVYLQSVLPLNPVYNMFTGHMKRQADVPVPNELLKKVVVESHFANGLRVTDDATMEIVQQVLAGKVNKDLVAKLRGRGVGLCGMDGQMLRCTELDPQLGHVGEIIHVDPTLIENLLNGGYKIGRAHV